MSGSMYDLSVTTFSPEGKIYQVEYATKAVETSETIVGIKCKDGIILGAEKLLVSRLLIDGTNRRIHNVDTHIGLAYNGKIPDGRHILTRARSESSDYTKSFDIPIRGNILSDRVSQYVHAYTLYGSYRPFGSAIILAAHDLDGFNLHMIEPSGFSYAYHACAIGKGKQTAKAEFEKRNFKDMNCKDALFYVAKLLHLCHEEFKDRRFEIEISWITKETNYEHQMIPKDLKEKLDAQALEEIEKEQM
jgi:20S proteasome subunit alpha 7